MYLAEVIPPARNGRAFSSSTSPFSVQTIDTNSVATNVNMAFINSTLPIMAFTAILICLRDLIAIVRRPASSFVKATEEEKIEQEISKEL